MAVVTTIFNQQDPRWAGIVLGSGPGTIGLEGCYLDAMASIAASCGKDTDPARLNQAFIAAKLFVEGDELTDDALTKVYGDIVYQRTLNYQTVPADMGQLQTLLAQPTTFVILEIDLGGGNTHFVVAHACDGTSVTIDNPWDGQTEPFSQDYGDAKTNILKYVVYQGTPAAASTGGTGAYYKGYDLTNQDSMKVAVDVLVRLQAGELVDASQLTTLQQTTSDQQAKIQSLEDTVTSLNGVSKTKDQTIAQLTGQVQSLEAQLEAAQQSVTSLKSLAAQVPGLQAQLSQAEKDRADAVAAQTSQNQAIAQLKNTSYTTASTSTLINALLTRLANRLTGKVR